jgi:hypothetical protein
LYGKKLSDPHNYIYTTAQDLLGLCSAVNQRLVINHAVVGTVVPLDQMRRMEMIAVIGYISIYINIITYQSLNQDEPFIGLSNLASLLDTSGQLVISCPSPN